MKTEMRESKKREHEGTEGSGVLSRPGTYWQRVAYSSILRGKR